MSSRRARGDEAKEQVVIKQLTSIAYNIKGWAMEDGNEHHEKFETILAYANKSTTSVSGIVARLRKEGLPEDQIFRQIPTPSEQGELEDGIARYLIVGFTPRIFDPKFNKAVGKKMKIGSETEPPVDTLPWKKGEIPILVVTEILDERPDGIQLWALLRPEDGLCTPFQIGQGAVFYRHEYRDSETAIHHRASSWNRLVAAQSVRPGILKPSSPKETSYERAKDTTCVILQPNQSLVNELLLLISIFKERPDKWFLEEMKTLLSDADDDIKFRPPPRNKSLRKFANKDEEFNLEDSKQLLLEVGDTIEGAHFTEENVLLLRWGLGDADIEYRLLRGFLAQGTHAVHEAISEILSGHPELSPQEIAARPPEDTVHKLKCIARTTYSCVQRVTPPPKSMPLLSATSETTFILVIVEKLHEMVRAGEVMDRRLRQLCGNESLDGSPPDIWTHYTKALDINHTNLAFSNVVRYLEKEQRIKNRGLIDMITSLVAVLERAGYRSTEMG